MKNKTRVLLGLATIVAALASVTSNAQSLIDPIGFCPPPATVTACTTATGPGGETIGVGTTTFGMFSNGAGKISPANPWYLFILVPEAVDGAAGTTPPVLTQVGGPALTLSSAVAFGDYTNSKSTPDLYTFTGTTGDSSMNRGNLFGGIEQAVFGSTPADFEVFEYTFTPNMQSWTPYQFNVGGSGLVAGTFLAGSAGSNPWSTPFTTTGLVCGYSAPGAPPLCGNSPPPPPPPTVPEPATLALLGLGLAGIAMGSRRRRANG